MTTQIVIPKELMDEIEKISPFPWREFVHPNGLVQVGDRNNKEVSLFLINKVAIAVGTGAAK